MIDKRVSVLLACVLGVSLGLAAQGSPPEDPIAALKALVDFPVNDRNAAPIYLEIAEMAVAGIYTREDLESGRADPPLYDEAVECGQFAPLAHDWFRVEQGEITFVHSLDMDQPQLLAHFRWVRGLRSRIEAATGEGRDDDAWNEVKRTVIVALHFRESKGVLISYLFGVMMLRVAAQQALRSEIPEVAENRALFETVVETCQRDRLRAEELLNAIQPLKVYLRLSGKNDKKVVYDFISLMNRLLEFKDHALGAKLFYMTVEYVATAASDQCWQIFFSCLPRLENSGNRWIQASVNGLFRNHDKAEARRMLVSAFSRRSQLQAGGG